MYLAPENERKNPDGTPAPVSPHKPIDIDAETLNVFRIEKLWKNEE